MKKHIYNVYVLVLLSLLSSCMKENDMPEGKYYGKVEIKGSPMSTTAINVFYDGEQVGTLPAEEQKTLTINSLIAGSSGKISLYRADNNEILGEKQIEVPKNATESFVVYCNDMFKLYGVLTDAERIAKIDPVPQDSVRYVIKFVNRVGGGTSFNTLDLDFIYFIDYSNYISLDKKLHLKKGVWSDVITIGCNDANGNSYFDSIGIGMLVSENGISLVCDDVKEYYFMSQYPGGALYLITLDLTNGGAPGNAYIILNSYQLNK